MPYLEITEIVLIYCNVAYNSYQQNSGVLYTFVPNKPFGQLLDIWLENFVFKKSFESDFLYVKVWFRDQNFNLLVTEGKINIALVIN